MSANDGWGDDEWPPTAPTIPVANTGQDGDDGWGDSSAINMGSNERAFNSDQSKGTSNENKRKFDDYFGERNDWSGVGRGIGRAKRMAEKRQSNPQNDNQWTDNNTNTSTRNDNQWSDNYSNTSAKHNSYERDNNSFGNNRSGFDSDRNSSKKVIQISPSFVGKVIGRGGQTIKELQSKSGAKININKDSGNTYETDVELCGSTEQIDCAQRLINDLIGGMNSFQSQNQKKTESSESKTEEFIDWGAAIKESEEATKKKWAALPDIKKQFYFEHSEVRAMNPDLVDKFRTDNNNIIVGHFNEGDDRPIPNPVPEFRHAFEHFPEVLEEIRKQGFEKPSPIQTQSWPILLSGVDLIGIAQTGTGKTLAYLLPAMIHIDSQPTPRVERPGPTALIMAPTRELAQQIEKECQKYRYRNIKCVCIYGGGDRNQQINCVGKGVEIVIATPGRLNDLCQAQHINLSSVSYLVLDEADRMLDMGFEPQIKKIMIDVRPNRHTVMMSATWPTSVRRLAVTYMKDPMQVYVGTLDLAAVHSVTQKIIITTPEEKREIMYDFIKNMKRHEKVIIFCGKKALTDDLASDCILQSIDCQSIHGDRDQHDREQALEDIKSGSVQILFATDVASRGLDIEDITHIFNYDFPRNVEEYVHRVGRTGRAGRKGESITLVTREDWRHAKELINILEEAEQEVPNELSRMADRYATWKDKHDAEVAACGGRPRGGGRGRGGGGGGGYGRPKW